MEITILKVVKADHFWAKEAPGTQMSEETRQFVKLSQQINDYFSMDQTMCVPAQGQYCVGKRPEDKLWYRVRVKTILHSKHGPQACCFLLDYAAECQIPCHWLREAPPRFMQLPWQAKEFRLYGLQPVTLTTSKETFETTKEACNRYDTSANEYVGKLVKESSAGAYVRVQSVDNSGVHHVKLYLRRTSGTVCVNDDLVSKEYAVYNEDKEVQTNLRMLRSPSPMANCPLAVPAGRVSPTSPPPLSPAPSEESSPPSGLAAMLGLNPLQVTEPVQTIPSANTQHQADREAKQEDSTGVPNNSGSSALPASGAAAELSRLTLKSEKNADIQKQQIYVGHSRQSSSVTTGPSVRAKESGYGLQSRQGMANGARTLKEPSLKPAGKNLSPRRMLKAARTLQPSSGRIIGNGCIAVNPECLKGSSRQESSWIPGAMNDRSLQPVVRQQEVRNRRSFPPDQMKSTGHEGIPGSSRSVESRLNAAYSQTSTLGKEWTQLVDKTRPVRQRSLSPIPVNVGTVGINARSPPMLRSGEVSTSPRVSLESTSAANVLGDTTSGHAVHTAYSNSAGMSGSDMYSTGKTQAAVLGNSAGRNDISGSKADSSGGAAKSDAKAEGSSISGADGSPSGGGDEMVTPSVHTGYTPARLPRINLHGNPLRDR